MGLSQLHHPSGRDRRLDLPYPAPRHEHPEAAESGGTPQQQPGRTGREKVGVVRDEQQHVTYQHDTQPETEDALASLNLER
jgi:hypothetical protein